VLTRLWAQWKRVAQRIGDFQARIILTLLYYLLLGVAGLCVRLLRDPLQMRHLPRMSVWVARPPDRGSLEDARRQF